MEMYLAGVSVRRIEDITEALWGARVSAGTISNLNKKIYGDIEEWRNRPLEAEYPYIYMDGIWLKRSWGGTVENVSILVAVGVNKEGYREVLGAAEGSREDAESWKNFCRYLKERGLRSAKLIVSDKSLGILEALGEFSPKHTGSAAPSTSTEMFLMPYLLPSPKSGCYAESYPRSGRQGGRESESKNGNRKAERN